jgi:syntaxin 7
MNLNKAINMQQLELQNSELQNLESQQVELEQDVKDINNIYKHISEIIDTQGQLIDTIEENMENTITKIDESYDKLNNAVEYYKSYKYYQYVLYGIAIIGTALLIF